MLDTTIVIFDWHTIWLAFIRHVSIFRVHHSFGRQFFRPKKFHLCLDNGNNLHDTYHFNNHDRQMFVRTSGKCA